MVCDYCCTIYDEEARDSNCPHGAKFDGDNLRPSVPIIDELVSIELQQLETIFYLKHAQLES